MANYYDRILTDILSANRNARQITTPGGERDLGTQSECPICKEVLEWREISAVQQGILRTIRYWSDCSCWLAKCADADRRSRMAQDHAADYRAEPVFSDVRSYQHFSLDTFEPERLANGASFVKAALRWLEQTSALPFANRSYTDPQCCLFFHSPGKGRGKTHLASAMAMSARAAGKMISIIDELPFAEQYWAAELEQKRSLALAPSDKAWLTVFDDMGGRENTPAGLRDMWYDLIGPRWLKRGWSIVTSNHTLEELVQRGTIDDRVYSRLFQMTGGKIITFDGIDQRLAGIE